MLRVGPKHIVSAVQQEMELLGLENNDNFIP